MKIFYCIPSMGGGGAERQLICLTIGLISLGWEVHVALLHEGTNFGKLKSSGAIIHKLTAWNNYDPKMLWQLLQIIRSVQPNLIQVWLFQMEFLGGAAAQLMQLPWIFSERSSEVFYSPTYFPTIKNRLRIFLASHANAIISNSSGGDTYWRKHLQGRVPQYIIPNIIPFEEIEAVNFEALPDIDIVLNQKVVLFAGRFDAGKNINTLIIALTKVLQQTNVVAILCGNGSEYTRIKQLVIDSAIAERVLLPGYVSQLIGLYKRAAVFVSLSLYEGRPNAVLEAAACSCPLVLSDIPAHREFLDEESAIFVNPYEAAEAAEAITRVLADPLQAKSRALKAWTAIQEFSMKKITSQYQQVYQEVLAQHCRRRNK